MKNEPQNNINNNEPITLGELKKEKSSKPIFALLVFALVLGVCFGLPYIKTFISDDFNLSELINNNKNNTSSNSITTTSTTTTSITTTTKITTTTSIQKNLTLLKDDTILNIDNIYLNNISISNNSLIYTISAKATINLDDTNYVLEIYNDSRSLLGSVKLSGIASTASNVINQTLNFDTNTNNYYLRLLNNNEDTSGV